MVAAHLLVALYAMREDDPFADGGVATQTAAFDSYELATFEMLGDQIGASDVTSPGEAVEQAAEAERAETLTPAETDMTPPTSSEVVETARVEVAEPVAREAERVTTTAASVLPPVEQRTSPAPVVAPAPAADPTPSPPLEATRAPEVTAAETTAKATEAPAADRAPPTEAATAEAPAANTAPPAEAVLPDLPIDPMGAEPAPSLDPNQADIVASEAPTPTEETVQVTESLTGAVADLEESAFVPRPRPEVVPEAVLRDYEQRRETAEAEDVRPAAQEAERPARERTERPARRRAAAPAGDTEARPRRAEASGGGSSAAAAPRDPGAGRAAVSSYQSRVYSHLQRHKRFPRGERRGGTVTVRFTLSASGAASRIALQRSSGNPALDQATLDMVRRASPFPAIPPDLNKRSMSFVVPVNYSVR